MPHVGQQMLTFSGEHDFTSFVEFVITQSLYILLNLSWDYVYGLMTGVFWISLTTLSIYKHTPGSRQDKNMQCCGKLAVKIQH